MSQNTNRTALLGKKLGMSQVWDENGFFVPVRSAEKRSDSGWWNRS